MFIYSQHSFELTKNAAQLAVKYVLEVQSPGVSDKPGRTDTQSVTLDVTNSTDTWLWSFSKEDFEESWRLKSSDGFPCAFWNLKKPIFCIKISATCAENLILILEKVCFFFFWFPCWEVASKDTNSFEDIFFLFYFLPQLSLPLPFLPRTGFPRVVVGEQMLKKRAKNKILVYLGSKSFQMLNELISDLYAITF